MVGKGTGCHLKVKVTWNGAVESSANTCSPHADCVIHSFSLMWKHLIGHWETLVKWSFLNDFLIFLLLLYLKKIEELKIRAFFFVLSHCQIYSHFSIMTSSFMWIPLGWNSIFKMAELFRGEITGIKDDFFTEIAHTFECWCSNAQYVSRSLTEDLLNTVWALHVI